MKRKRSGDDDEEMMDMDENDDWEDEEDARMEVDGEPRKKMKTAKGSKKTLVTAVDRTAKKDRSMAGLGGPEVSFLSLFLGFCAELSLV